MPPLTPEKFQSPAEAKSALPRLIANLKSPDDMVRAQAVATLGAMGPAAREAAPTLVEVAVSNRGHAQALQALAKIDDDQTIQALRQLLAGGRGRCKCGISFIDVVAAAGEPIVPHLISFITTLPEKQSPENAAAALAAIGEPAVPNLVGTLEHRDAQVRLTAIRILGNMQGKAKLAVPAIEKRMAMETGSMKLHAATSLVMVVKHQEALDLLHGTARGDDKAAQVEALHGLVRAGANAKELIPAMVALAKKTSEVEGYLATTVLATIGKDSAPPLIAAMNDANRDETQRLAYALRRLGADGAVAVPTFIAMLEGKDHALASIAADSLPSFGPESKKAMPHLLGTLQSDVFALRQFSAEAIFRIDRDQASHTIVPVIEILRKGNEQEKVRALQHFRELGVLAKAAAPAILEHMKNEPLERRVQLADTLSHVDAGSLVEVMPTLIEGLQSKNSQTSRTSLRLLNRLGPKAKDASGTLRIVLADALMNPGKGGIYAHQALQSLKQIDPSASYMPILIAALNSDISEIREEVHYLITDIVGRSALEPINAAVSSGQLRNSQEVTALLKQLRAMPQGTN
jgi:HEAT repeat protein